MICDKTNDLVRTNPIIIQLLLSTNEKQRGREIKNGLPYLIKGAMFSAVI